MKDYVLEQRQNNYRKCDFDLQGRVETKHLELRKQAIDDIIHKSRMANYRTASIRFEIDQEALEVQLNYKNYIIIDIQQQIDEVMSFLTSHDTNYVKLGIVAFRKYLSVPENSGDSLENIYFILNAKPEMINYLIHLIKSSSDMTIVVNLLNLE